MQPMSKNTCQTEKASRSFLKTRTQKKNGNELRTRKLKKTTTKTEQKRKKDNQKESKSKNKKNTEEYPNNTVNKLLKDNEQNIKRIQENKKQLSDTNTSGIIELKIKIKETAEKQEEKERKKKQEEINTLRMSNLYLNSSLNPSLSEGYIQNPTRI
jgi:hypothetical protein